MLSTLELVHLVGGFAVSESGDRVEQIVLGLVNDWVGVWIGYVFQQVWLHKGEIL
jgi:hypothetical protein